MIMTRFQLVLLIGLSFSPTIAHGLNNGQGLTPALGWSSWNYFGDNINETVIGNVAQGIVSTGLSAVGYKYINLDAGVWLPTRDQHDQLQPDPSKFPSGLNAMSAKLRDLKLTFGLYTDLSNRTVGKVCGTGPGSFGHYEDDAAAIVRYGAGFVKIDYCAYDWSGAHIPSLNSSLGYWQKFRDAFNATGRSIFIYFCPRSISPTNVSTAPKHSSIIDGPPFDWSVDTRRGLANSLLTEYHNSDDTWESAMSNLDALLGLAQPEWNQRGYWQDADMLHTCNFGAGRRGAGMTLQEYSAQFVVWAIMASNIIISVPPSTLAQNHPECLDLLKNEEVLAMNQDPAALAPQLLFQTSPAGKNVTTDSITAQGFARRLHDGSIGCVLLNRESTSSSLGVTWSQLSLPPHSTCAVRDILRHTNLGTFDAEFNSTLTSHQAIAIRISCTDLLTV